VDENEALSKLYGQIIIGVRTKCTRLIRNPLANYFNKRILAIKQTYSNRMTIK